MDTEEKKSGIEKELKRKIIGILTVLFPDAKIYLFGSRARGTHQDTSDIDLALDMGKRIEPRALVGEAHDVLNQLFMLPTIDILDVHLTSPEMQDSILTEGILWKE